MQHYCFLKFLFHLSPDILIALLIAAQEVLGKPRQHCNAAVPFASLPRSSLCQAATARRRACVLSSIAGGSAPLETNFTTGLSTSTQRVRILPAHPASLICPCPNTHQAFCNFVVIPSCIVSPDCALYCPAQSWRRAFLPTAPKPFVAISLESHTALVLRSRTPGWVFFLLPTLELRTPDIPFSAGIEKRS
jgi:hypothetical protein